MAKRISSSQLRSKINKFNQAVRNYDQAVRKYKRDVNRAIDNYNHEVRAHNARVRSNRQRIQSGLAKLRIQSTTTTTVRYTLFTSSVHTLNNAYTRLEEAASNRQLSPVEELILALSERENANSLEVINALLGDTTDVEESPDNLQSTNVTNELSLISEDLNNRWMGAIYSLSPQNPDAARHFCTSAREVMTQILEIKAPDIEVINVLPECERTDQGKPTRRAKIKFFLHQKGMNYDALENFVEQDIENIVQLFGVFNAGTHGSAGKFDLLTLSSIKRRVEDGIIFLSSLVN